MKPFIMFFINTTASFFTTCTVWLVSFFAWNQPFLMSSVIAIGSGAGVYLSAKGISRQRFLKKNQLTRKEYQYIKKQLAEAGKKIRRLTKTLLTIRTISSIRQNLEVLRVVNKIYSITKKEPKRFYLAESFYYSHLDSLVEISEKYAFLTAQPKKNAELTQSLKETRRTLTELAELVERDLYDVLAKDIDHLHYELDVAKLTVDKNKRL